MDVDVHRAIVERLRAIPGGSAASVSTCLPLSGTCFGNGLVVEGELFDPSRARPWVLFRAVGDGYEEAVGMPLLRGRRLERADIDRGEANVVVNKALADAYFPGKDPIGQRFRSSTPPSSKLARPPWLTVVGVVGNTAAFTLAGLGIGLVVAWLASRLIQSLLFGISPRDPLVFVTTTVILLTIAMTACWLPARRAARLSPLEALRG